VSKQPYFELRYREQTKGISGFPGRPIPESQRWEAYVEHIGTRLFDTQQNAMAWITNALAFLPKKRTRFIVRKVVLADNP